MRELVPPPHRYPPDQTKRCVTDAGRHLIELIQGMFFGRIEHLRVRNGQPVLDPLPRIIRTLKLGQTTGGGNVPRPQVWSSDFALNIQVQNLLDLLARIGDGLIDRIEIAQGLPSFLEIDDSAIADPTVLAHPPLPDVCHAAHPQSRHRPRRRNP